jgi:hypothetical protein
MAKELVWVRAVLETTPLRWTNFIENLPKELLEHIPAPGEWSAISCLQHLIDTERFVFPTRVGCFLRGEDFPAFNPDTQGTAGKRPVDIDGLLQDFLGLRIDSLTTLEKVRPADLSRTARHAELGLVSLSEMLHEWAAHDLMHTVQAEKAIMQPLIQGSGAWKVYFTDHIA